VNDDLLKIFTCPITRASCPLGNGSNGAELASTGITTATNNAATIFTRSYTSLQIREETFCKIHVEHLGPYTNVKYEYNTMNIYIETATNVEISLIYVAPGTSYSTATIEPLKAGAGNIKQIPQIKLGQSWWIMYEPTKLRAAELTIMTWVSKDFNAAA
jgi:hypothetical protein